MNTRVPRTNVQSAQFATSRIKTTSALNGAMYTRVMLNIALAAACAKVSKQWLIASLGVTDSPAGFQVAIAPDVSRVVVM